jgi:hypothetical protein
MLHFTLLVARFRVTSFFRIHSNIKERTKQSFKKGRMTLSPFFVFLKKEGHAFLPVSFPCCEPTTFYTIYYPFHFLAASLRRFMAVQCEHSEAHEREKRERNPCRDPIRFYTVKKSARFLYGFLSFSHWKLRFILRFSHGFFPTASRTYAIMYTGKYRNRRRIRCLCNRLTVFCNRLTVFLNRHMASLYRYTASLYRISPVIS